MNAERQDGSKPPQNSESRSVEPSADVVDHDHVVTAVERKEFWRGPVPPPSMLSGYNEVLPGAADRIIRMAENEAANRQACRSERIDIERQISSRAQWFSFIITMTIIVGALVLIGMGKTGGGGIAAIISALAALVLAFFGGRHLYAQGEPATEPEETSNNAGATA